MDSRTDEQLVAAHLGGEREALAGIYDRYADALHDTAAAMLRDRHEAADAVQDVFLIGAERLGQLRDPSRLKPWLFAILRNEVYRRTRRRTRVRPTDFSEMPDVADVADPGDAVTAAVSYEALAASVRGAAAGLDPRDQLVLELSVRQELAGPDLAAALGVSIDQSYVLVHRMRQRVERSLGALAVARAGRKDCAELERILAGWDGTFNVLVRKRVARHVEGCDICGETKRRYAALTLLAAAPAFGAPAWLREVVLGHADTTQVETPDEFSADGGFPTVARIARRGGALLVAIAVGLVGLVGAGTAVVLSRGGGGGDAFIATQSVAEPVGSASPSSSTGNPTTASSTASSTTSTAMAQPTTTSLAAAVPPTAIAPATTTASPPTTTSPPPSPDPGFLELSSALVDLGADAESGTLTLHNSGGARIDWALDGDPAPFTWVAGPQSLGPGESSTIELSLDRSQLDEGTVSRMFTVTAGGAGGGPVEITARVEREPVVRIHSAPRRISCPWSVPPTVSATVSDESALSSVELRWDGPGNSGAAHMGRSGGGWSGRLDIEPVNGTWSYIVTATDERGNIGSAGGTLAVDGC